MRKNSTTGRKSAPTKATRQKKDARALRTQLARDLAAVLSNPECPSVLHNDIGEALCEMSSDLTDKFWHSPEMILHSINGHIAKEEKRRGDTKR